MPIDASIPYEALRGLQKAKPYDPMVMQARLQRQQGGQQGPNAAVLRLGQEQQENQEIAAIAQQYGDDYDEMGKAIIARFPHRADVVGGIQTALKDGAAKHLEMTQAARAELRSRLAALQGANDDETWQPVAQGIVKDFPQLSPIFAGRPYSPELQQSVLSIGRSQDQWLKAQGDAAQSLLDGKKQEGAARLIVAADTPAKQTELQGLLAQAGWKKFLGVMPDAASAQAYLDKQAKADPEKAAKVGSFEDYVVRTYGPNPTPDQIIAARKKYGQADDRPRGSVSVSGGGGGGGNAKTWETTGADVLQTIPAQWRATVKKIGDYDEDPTKMLAARGGERSMVMRWVNQYNPNYKQDEFAVRSPTRKAFTTGTQGQQINAMNTAIGHIDQLGVLVEGLNNGDFTPGNKAWNSLRTMFGSDKVTNFDTLKDALSGEVASILSKSGATVSGIAEAKEKINAAASPAQLAGYIKTQIPIMGSKLAALDYQFKQAMGDDHFSALSPDSKRVLEKYGFNPAHPTLESKAGGPPVPSPGTKRTVNGVTYTWDGKGWAK